MYQIALNDQFAAFVDRVLADGNWDSADDLVMYALSSVMDELRRDEHIDQDALRNAIQIGIDQADRGDAIEGPIVLDRLRAKLHASRKQPTCGSRDIGPDLFEG